MQYLLRWIATSLAVLAVPYFVSGVRVQDFGTALAFALVLGLFNTLLRPILLFITLPFTVITLGFFVLMINAFLFQIAAAFVSGIVVDGFLSAFLASLVVSVVTWLMVGRIGKRSSNVYWKVGRMGGAPPRPRGQSGSIDLEQDPQGNWR